LSVVAPKKHLEALNLPCEREWSCISLDQTFGLSITGIAAAFTRLLADAGVPVFIVSSYDTDHILVPKEQCDEAVKILEKVEPGIGI